MVLLAGVKGMASLELWPGQLSWSEKVLSPWKQKHGLWDRANKKGLFFPCSGERRTSERHVLPPPFLGAWEKLQGAISQRLQGWEQLQELAVQGPLCVQMPSCSLTSLSLQHVNCLVCSLFPLLQHFTSLFPFLFSLSLSLKYPCSFQVFFFTSLPPLSPKKNHWINNCLQKKICSASFFLHLLPVFSVLTPGFSE